MDAQTSKKAVLYRMVMDKHVCPWGLKSKDLLEREGYAVEDHWLTTREATDAFKAQEKVETTPQTFIDGMRVGGYTDLLRFFHRPVPDPKAVSYVPVIVLFAMSAALALAASWAAGTLESWRTLQWAIAFAMCLLAAQKLQDVESFATMFLGYDLLARRWVAYAKIYPFAEALAGLLMVAGVAHQLSGAIALFIGGVGAVSVFYAVYIQKREIKCACVGGNSRVPLGFVSLSENLMMIAMGVWMLI